VPAKKKPGMQRVGFRCEPWFADRVAEAADRTGRSMSSYVRVALIEQMKRDGVPTDGPTAPVKKPGRPKPEGV
jgi:hypothetical protein